MARNRLTRLSVSVGILLALRTITSIAAEPGQLVGTFSGNITGFLAYSGIVSQTLSPDNGALSLLFESFKIEEQSGLKRRDSAYYVFRTSVNPVAAGKISADLRGNIAVLSGTKCLISMHAGAEQVSSQAARSRQVFLRKKINVAPGDSEITIVVALSCEGLPGKTKYIAQVDSLDLTWHRNQ